MKINKKHSGVTLVELMIVVLMSSIIVLGLGVALVDGQRGYNKMYNRVHSTVVIDAYTARIGFDAVARKATIKKFELDTANQWLKLFYFSDPLDTSIDEPDRSALFYISGNQLLVDHHNEASNTSLNTQTLATTVQQVWFSCPNVCAQMQLELSNGNETLLVTCSSIRHNEE